MFSERNFVHLSTDQISYYDETLKKQIEGSYTYDGKKIHVMSQIYGARSAPRAGCLAHFEVELLAQKVLRELARDAESKSARDADNDTAKPDRLKKAA